MKEFLRSCEIMGKREKTNESSQSINQLLDALKKKKHKVQRSPKEVQKKNHIIKDMHEGNGGLFL